MIFFSVKRRIWEALKGLVGGPAFAWKRAKQDRRSILELVQGKGLTSACTTTFYTESDCPLARESTESRAAVSHSNLLDFGGWQPPSSRRFVRMTAFDFSGQGSRPLIRNLKLLSEGNLAVMTFVIWRVSVRNSWNETAKVIIQAENRNLVCLSQMTRPRRPPDYVPPQNLAFKVKANGTLIY